MEGAADAWSRAVIALYAIGGVAVIVVLSILVGVCLYWLRRRGERKRADLCVMDESPNDDSLRRKSSEPPAELPV